MDPESTRERLLANAERLMAEKGIAATSVREITDASDANVASVNYYFGSKMELLLELLKNRFSQLDKELLTRIEQAEQSAQEDGPGARALVGAYFDALADLGQDVATGAPGPFIILIERASAEQEAVLERAQDYQAPGISRLRTLLGAKVPPEHRSRLEPTLLIDLMFSASVSAIPLMGAGTGPNVQLDALKEFLFAGVDAYLTRLAAP